MKFLKLACVSAFTLLLGALLFTSWTEVQLSARAPSSLYGHPLASWLGAWRSAVDPLNNAYFAWRTSPLAMNSQLLSSETLNFLILYSGMIAVGLRMKDDWGRLLAPLLIFISLCQVIQYAGPSSPYTQSIIWLPWLCYALGTEWGQRQRLRWCVIVSLAICVGLWANQLAPLVMCCGIALAAASPGKSLTRFDCFLPFLAATLVGWVPAPLPPIPDYPQGSQVVPEDGFPGIAIPYFGPTGPVQFINREAVRTWLAPACWGLLPAAAALLLLPATREARRGKILAGCLWIALACDVLGSEEMALLGPLGSMSRIVPHWWFFPLSHLVFAALIVSIPLLIALHGNVRWALAMTLLLALFNRTPPSLKNHPEWMQPWWSFIRAPHQTDSGRSDTLSLLISPSYFVFREAGLEILQRADTYKRRNFRPVLRREADVTASHRPDLLENLFGKNTNDRWTSGHGGQDGSEWLMVRFHEPLPLDGAELTTGSFPSDFPRGLRVSYAETCDHEISVALYPAWRKSLKVVSDFPQWRGAVQFTASGYPYFRGEYDVRVIFPSTLHVQCLLFEQVAKELRYDWSVVVLKVLDARERAQQ